MIETQLLDSLKMGAPAGVPINMSHDKHRLIGWALPKGVYVAKDMARQVALMLGAETTEELEQFGKLREAFREHAEERRATPHLAELRDRLVGFAGDDCKVECSEAAALCAPGLAAAIFPDLFDPESPIVDKDGLIDLDALLSVAEQVEPGVFHERSRDLILFAHPFFRRNLSRRNCLNQYVLRSFCAAAETEEVRGRLRLDPDMVGHPGSVRPIMELEWWNGPSYNDDISTIPTGVTEHKSSGREREYSEIDKTQLWWKDPERRGAAQIRTFEIEELIEQPSVGLGDNNFGCRYAHAEYDADARHISHFDGAIRAYGGDAYLERIDLRIDRAGKRSSYNKLFRLDGEIPVPQWKRVLSDFYRGNPLVPEYLGAPSEADTPLPSPPRETADRQTPALAFYVSYEIAARDGPPTLSASPDEVIEWDGQPIRFVEAGPGPLGELVGSYTDQDRFGLLHWESPVVNISPILLPGMPAKQEDWVALAHDLVGSIRVCASTSECAWVSVTVRWFGDGLARSFSVGGTAPLVADFLEIATTILRVDRSASEWIEELQTLLLKLAPELDAPVDWPASLAKQARIVLPRDATQVRFVWPGAIALPTLPDADETPGSS
ncbi:hypothetical protein [Sphingopyxis sp. 550A]